MTTHTIKPINRQKNLTTIYPTITVDENTTLKQLKEEHPKFFEFPFTQNETYEMYRGFIICEGEQEFSDHSREKRVSAHIYDTTQKDFNCVTVGSDCNHDTHYVKTLIDRIIKEGITFYGMSYKGPEFDPEE